MRKFTLCLAFLFMVASVGSNALAAKALVNGIDANFPPFAFVDKTGKPAGFDVEVMAWIAKDQGFKVEHKPMDWDTIVTSLVTKKIDMVASGMSITEERKKQVAFSDPYWIIKQVLVVKKDSAATVDQLMVAGKKIGVQRGTSEAKWLDENVVKKGKAISLVLYDSAPMAVEDVLNGRIDAAAMDDAPARDAISKGKAVKEIGTFGMPEEDFGYAVRKDDKDLLKKINAGLKKIMASPTWEELKKKYELK